MARSRRGVKSEQRRSLVQKRRGRLAGLEVGMIDHVFEERNVGLDAADAELAQGAIHALAGVRELAAPGGDLHQQRIVVRRDHRAAVGRAAIQPDAEAGRRAIGVDLAVIGHEVVRRDLRW